MNKAQLIDAIAKDAEISKVDARKALDAFIKNTTEALKANDRITLIGFGTFSIAKRNARTGRNPQTGNEIEIPSKNVIKFKAGSELTDNVQ